MRKRTARRVAEPGCTARRELTVHPKGSQNVTSTHVPSSGRDRDVRSPDKKGRIDCFCVEQGDFCESNAEGVGYADRTILMREATDMVAAGDMLPSDGPFYVGVTASEFVIRWKCDGSVAGRVATEGSPLVAIGALAG